MRLSLFLCCLHSALAMGSICRPLTASSLPVMAFQRTGRRRNEVSAGWQHGLIRIHHTVQRYLSLRATVSSSEKNVVTSLPPVPNNVHRIVLMRHGESEFNNANVFTGWCDVALTARGVVEAVEAGQVFASHGLTFGKCYCSLLTRSIVTAQRSLEAAGVAYTPMTYDWRLNERHYGALQGLGKERTADRLGRALVMEWRRSYHARPPLMTAEHPHYPIIYNDPRYQRIDGIKLPLGESLEDCQLRVVDAWTDIVQDFTERSRQADSPYSLIVAHANSLRALVMHLDEIPVDEIEGLNIPTAIPFFYDICLSTGAVLASNVATGKFRGTYISDDRKKRNFLERRRAANDPFLWALHDHEVTRRMLIGDDDGQPADGDDAVVVAAAPEGLEGMEEEAKRNTELFSSTLKRNDPSNEVRAPTGQVER